MDDNLRHLSDHPRFQGRDDPFADLEPYPEEPDFNIRKDDFDETEPDPNATICAWCVHSRDIRPWWRRLLRRPTHEDLACDATPRQRMRDPITGRMGYNFLGSQTFTLQPLELCRYVNLNGRCRKYRLKVTYG